MNESGDYSASYCILQTDSLHKGHGMVCTDTSSLFVCARFSDSD